jgi:hypothetical protein
MYNKEKNHIQRVVYSIIMTQKNNVFVQAINQEKRREHLCVCASMYGVVST